MKNYTYNREKYHINKVSKHRYVVNERYTYNPAWKYVVVGACIMASWGILSTLFFFYKDNNIFQAIYDASESYLFLAMLTFLIFIIFKREKKSYNKNRNRRD